MRHLPLLRAVVGSLVAATLLAACDEPSPQATLPPSASPEAALEREFDLDATSEAAAAQLGGHAAAAYAVLKAADNGYSPYQTATAIDAGLLDPSGSIPDAAPALAPGDAISGSGVGIRLLLAVAGGVSPVRVADVGGGASTRDDLEQVFAAAGDQVTSGRWLAWVLGATGRLQRGADRRLPR